ncbi:LRR receptor kinase BAK1-like isoform X2 [Salvia hispanica]|uniref:LRR receptor kinase BAK1-like isoform X2 n=1 Tax=Salvia hispanica TaxID=49212 RepID=UPI0020095D37|nr:LRR receptor kinase BAK1-like isoform X2 [Salvia hispanica]
MVSSSRDNWEKLVNAVVKREEIWQLCHQNSFSTIASDTPRTSYSSGESLRIPSDLFKRILVPPPPQPPPQPPLTSLEARRNVSGTNTRKLIPAWLWRRKPKFYDVAQDDEDDQSGLRIYSQRELLVATDSFSDKNILVRGGRGKVYKGRLADGTLAEVERVPPQAAEIDMEMISIATHWNVIRARGSCITQKEKLLVYPYMDNGSVAFWLRERKDSLPPLDWLTRMKIALGAAKGLAYLHHICPREIIHCDVKASNILLDEYFEAVLANLSLGEYVDCCGDDIVTPVKGTIGHIAPEYLATGKCSVKSDVFGYGVFLLELITAKSAFDLARFAYDNDMLLLDWVNHIYKEREWKVIVDAELQGKFLDEEVEDLLQIALICTQDDPEGRPTMLEVVRRLDVAYRWAKGDIEWSKEDFKGDILEGQDAQNISLDKLHAATEGFSNKIISEDSFNVIYKGWLDGYPVAVKRYNSQSLEYCFERELEIGRICLPIPNLIHVIGFCRMPEVQLLVFPLMVNGSVDSWLTGRYESRPPLTWKQRKNIAIGTARGLAHLHDKCEKKIIHCDVKAANIMLDDKFEPVVADFKSAKIMDHNVTHITTSVTGTIGHIAPEYIASADEKDMMYVDWVKKNYEERRWESMADDEGGDDEMEAVVKLLMKIAVLCTRYNPDRRPRMSDVVMMLKYFGCGWELL